MVNSGLHRLWWFLQCSRCHGLISQCLQLLDIHLNHSSGSRPMATHVRHLSQATLALHTHYPRLVTLLMLLQYLLQVTCHLLNICLLQDIPLLLLKVIISDLDSNTCSNTSNLNGEIWIDSLITFSLTAVICIGNFTTWKSMCSFFFLFRSDSYLKEVLALGSSIS